MSEKMPLSVSEEERERAISLSRRKYESDLESNLLTAYERGRRKGIEEARQEIIRKNIEEGIQEGKLEGINEVAKKALLMNMPVDDIISLTNLSRDAIEALRAD